jgi:hypothetical protein
MLVSRILEHFLIHVRSLIHTIKQMGLEDKFKEAAEAVETAYLAQEEAEGGKPFHLAAGAVKAAHDKAQKNELKKIEEDEAPQTVVMAKTTAKNRSAGSEELPVVFVCTSPH